MDSSQGGQYILVSCKAGTKGYSTAIKFGSYIGGYPITRTGTFRVDDGAVFNSRLIVAETATSMAVGDGSDIGEQIVKARKTIAIRISESNRGNAATAVFDASPDGKKAEMFRKKCLEINPPLN